MYKNDIIFLSIANFSLKICLVQLTSVDSISGVRRVYNDLYDYSLFHTYSCEFPHIYYSVNNAFTWVIRFASLLNAELLQL